MSHLIKLSAMTINIGDVVEIEHGDVGEIILFIASPQGVNTQVLTGADAVVMREWLAADYQAMLDYFAAKGAIVDVPEPPPPLSDVPPF